MNTHKFTHRLGDVNYFLRRNLVWMLLVILVFFTWKAASIAQDTRAVVDRTQVIAQDVKKILCENTPLEECDLEQAVKDLKKDNERQTNMISCLLVIIGESEFITPEAEARCQEGIDSPSTQPTPKPQNKAPSENKNDNTNKPSPSGNGGGGTSEPDNEGVIVNLPLLPEVHIPSPF